MCKFLCGDNVFISLGQMPRSGIVWLICSFRFNFLRNCQNCFPKLFSRILCFLTDTRNQCLFVVENSCLWQFQNYCLRQHIIREDSETELTNFSDFMRVLHRTKQSRQKSRDHTVSFGSDHIKRPSLYYQVSSFFLQLQK